MSVGPQTPFQSKPILALCRSVDRQLYLDRSTTVKSTNMFVAATAALSFVGVASLAYAQTPQPESDRPATTTQPQTQPQSQTPMQSQVQPDAGAAKAATPDSTARSDNDRTTTNMQNNSTSNSTNNNTSNSTDNRLNTGADGMNRADRTGNTGMDNSTANESADRRNMRTERDSNSGFTERAPRADRN